MNEIQITCQTETYLPFDELEPFQGDAKILHKEEFEALRKSILDDGFCFAIHYWRDERDGKNYIIDGHQRRATVKQLVEIEGYKSPNLPVVPVLAGSFEEAKRKVLAGISQYGTVNEKGIYQLMIETGESAAEILARVKIPEINMGKFMEKFFTENSSKDANDLGKAEPANTTMGSHSENVRMVQLYFNSEDHADFLEAIEALGQAYETDNVTDTVLRCVLEAHSTLSEQ